MNQEIIKNKSTSCTIQYTAKPISLSPDFHEIQKRGFVRNVGVFLAICQKYLGPDIDLFKKAGVYLTGLVPKASWQANLFEPDTNRAKWQNISNAVEKINTKTDCETVTYAGEGINNSGRQQNSHNDMRYMNPSPT